MCEQCDQSVSAKNDLSVGERVLAVQDVDTKNSVIKVFGAGVYEGKHVPHWMDLDLLVRTAPKEVQELAQKAVEEMLEGFNDPETPQRLSNTALGLGLSTEKAAKLLDEYFEQQKKYWGLSPEQATTEFLKMLLEKQVREPRIRLDSTDPDEEPRYVYGVHCVFARERDMQQAIDMTVAEFAQKDINVKVEEVKEIPQHADV